MRAAARGFTLLELMVALTIFVVISTGAYFMLTGMISAHRHVEEHSDQLNALQRWLIISERDLLQMAPAAATGKPALSYAADPAQIVFSRRGWSNPLGHPRSELQRVEYRLDEEGRIERHSFSLSPLATGAAKQPLLSHVKTIAAQFMDQKRQWHGDWQTSPEHLNALPQAIELSIDLDGMGPIRQIIPIASVPDAAP